MKQLGIDCDGVVFDFSGRFVQIANELFGTKFSVLDQHDWNFKPWFSEEQVDLAWGVIRNTKNFWQSLRALPGTDGLRSLPRNVQPIFITSRIPTAGNSAHDQTCAALRSNFYITHPLVLVVENPSAKIPLCKALDLDNFVDDKPSTIKQMFDAGLRTYAKLTPYNSASPFPEGVHPVETLDEFLKLELGGLLK